MHPTRWIPISLIFAYIAAAAVYAYYRDWRRVSYWIAAAVLNASITF